MKKKCGAVEASRSVKRWARAMAMGIVLCGCASGPTAPDAARSAMPTQVYTAMAPHPERSFPAGPSDGSLYAEGAALTGMFIDTKARRIGDILTIRIVESSSATNKASTTTDRSSDLSAGIDGFFNAEKRFANDHPFFNPFASVKGSIDSKFEGTGQTQRSGALNAYMTARVADVLPNGNLVIEGNREVRVNAENQMITLTGIVRPRDISADNVIQSTYIADARIAYSGTGVLNDRQRPGWLTRILDKVWPF